MRRWSFALVLLATSCGPDSPPVDCHADADFRVTISAEYGPLPADTVLRLHYGGRPADDPEELVLADPGTPTALFCYVSDRNGNYDPDEPWLGSTTPSMGAGGGTGQPGGPIEGLLCKLWTDGSANLDVVTQMYGTTSVKLQTKKGVCTVESKVTLALADGGA